MPDSERGARSGRRPWAGVWCGLAALAGLVPRWIKVVARRWAAATAVRRRFGAVRRRFGVVRAGECLVEPATIEVGLIEGAATQPVRQSEPGCFAHIVLGHYAVAAPGGMRDRRPRGNQVTAQPVHPQRRAGRGDPDQLGFREADIA